MQTLLILLIAFMVVQCSMNDSNDHENKPIANKGVIAEKTVHYKHGNVNLEGYLAYSSAIKGKRPAVLVIHPWMGIDEFTKLRTKELAKLGYIAFALDMYGKGIRASSNKEAADLAKPYWKDRKLMRERAFAGFQWVASHPSVDPNRIAGIGYCFGGNCILELARKGTNLVGAVSFHGNLNTPNPEDAKNIKAKLLVLHGETDPIVPPEEVAAFKAEMSNAGVDLTFIEYPGAKHAFTNPKANSKNSQYQEHADKASWAEMKKFLTQIF